MGEAQGCLPGAEGGASGDRSLCPAGNVPRLPPTYPAKDARRLPPTPAPPADALRSRPPLPQVGICLGTAALLVRALWGTASALTTNEMILRRRYAYLQDARGLYR